jgi:hypothetical protein
MQLHIAPIATVLLVACASGRAPVQTLVEFSQKGEIVFLGGSASWDDDQVVGPLINVSQRKDGSWAGLLNNQILDVNVYPARAAGVYLTMTWDDKPGQRVITAQWQGRLHRFEIHPDRFLFRGPTRSFTLQRRGEAVFGPGNELKFNGEAREQRPPMPQFGLALLATFMAAEAQGHDASGDPTMPRRQPGQRSTDR